MRPNRLTRALVGAATVLGVAVGGSLATAGGAVAASGPATKPAASAESIAPLAVNNLGLSSWQAKNVQCFLRVESTYTGSIDGLLGSRSWAAMQRHLAAYWGYPADEIDGIVGPKTIRALQRMLAYGWGYDSGIDGIAGPGTRAAFQRFANDMSEYRRYC